MLGHKECCTIIMNASERDDVMKALREAVESARKKLEFAQDEYDEAKAKSLQSEVHHARGAAVSKAHSTHRVLKNLLEALL